MVTTGALVAFGTGSAHAADATWTPSGVVKYEGDLTLELDGASAVSCPDIEFTGSVFQSVTAVPFTYDRWWRCEDDSVFQLTSWWGSAHVDDDGGYYLDIGVLDGTSPFGGYWGTAGTTETSSATFVNAAGGNPSQVVFSDTVIGWRPSDMAPISITGVLDVTPTTGSGTVTLVP